MSMTDPRDILGRSGKLYDGDRFGNHVGSAGSEDVNAQHAIRLSIGDDLDQTVRFVETARSPIGGEGKLADPILRTALLDMFFGQTDGGDLRPGVYDSGNSAVIDMGFLPGQFL